MEAKSKDQLFLDVAATLTKFYLFMAHSLRVVAEDTSADQLPLEMVRGQLDQAWTILLPLLEGNPVMKHKIENDYNMTLKLTGAHREMKREDPGYASLKQEAHRLGSYAREKSASLSDLVAIFRRL
jgi:hypothetical protein